MSKINKKYSAEAAMSLVWSPMRSVPTEQGDKTVSTSSGVLFADASATDGHGVRRLRVKNTDASATCGLFFIAAGGTATGLSIGNGMKLAAGEVFETTIGSNMRVAAVSSSGTITVNVLVHDLI